MHRSFVWWIEVEDLVPHFCLQRKLSLDTKLIAVGFDSNMSPWEAEADERNTETSYDSIAGLRLNSQNKHRPPKQHSKTRPRNETSATVPRVSVRRGRTGGLLVLW